MTKSTLRRISKTKLLDFGGKDGILADTGPSVVYDLFYKTHVTDDHMLYFKLLMIIVPFGTLILLAKNLKLSKKFLTNSFIMI